MYIPEFLSMNKKPKNSRQQSCTFCFCEINEGKTWLVSVNHCKLLRYSLNEKTGTDSIIQCHYFFVILLSHCHNLRCHKSPIAT